MPGRYLRDLSGRMPPDLSSGSNLGSTALIGVDEAGRGPLAGPVVAAAVLLCDGGIKGLDDSKKLSERCRIALESEIKARCRWAVGVASVEEIDRINILQATMLAMTRAVDTLVGGQSAHHRHAIALQDGIKRQHGWRGSRPCWPKFFHHAHRRPPVRRRTRTGTRTKV